MSLRHDVAPTDVPLVQRLAPESLAVADQVDAFLRPAPSGAPAVVVELRDAHRNLLARTVLETAQSREQAIDELLRVVRLDRCSDFVTDPLGKGRRRRIVASVCPSAGSHETRYEHDRSSAPQMA